MRRNRLQALRIAGGGQVIAVIGAAIARAFAIGQEQPPLPRRGRGQREVVEPGAQPPLPRLDPVGKKILPRDGGPDPDLRSEWRPVGKAGVSTCGSRWSPDHYKQY